MMNGQKKGSQIDYSAIDRYSDDCEHHDDAAKDLLDDGFNNSSEKLPDEYAQTLSQAEDKLNKAMELLGKAKGSDLCE